jgi:predicted metal-dependent hydrolase
MMLPPLSPEQKIIGYWHTITLGEQHIEYRLCRARRKSIGFIIDNQGLYIRAPHWVSHATIHQSILEKQHWILKKLDEQSKTPPPPTLEIQWQEGSVFPYLGKETTLCITQGSVRKINYDASTATLHFTIKIPYDHTQLKAYLRNWLKQEAKRYFSMRLAFYANALKETNYTFSLTSAKTQWGSCTTQRKIRLNWRLIHTPPHLIDYVVIHELAHLQEMNHSTAFWNIVKTLCPNFKIAKKELTQLAKNLPVI